jgi:hypothetical protein
MRKTALALLLLILATLPALALEGSDAVYAGGTISGLKEGTPGKVDLTSDTELVFPYTGGRLAIPYGRIESYEHSQEVAVHLGVAPAIAVGLIKSRRRNHFVRLTFRDGENRQQVVVFEIPKTMPSYLMPTLWARAPQTRCKAYSVCGPVPRTVAKPNKGEETTKDSGAVPVAPSK